MRKQLICLACLCISFCSYAQTTDMVTNSVSLPSFSLLDIEPNNSTLVLTLDSPTEAGLMNKTKTITGQKWLNYTSALPLASPKRTITIQNTSGTAPLGIQLYVGAEAATGGFGQLGSSLGYVLINNSAKILISNIGSTYTGNGVNQGHSLNYKIEISDVSVLDAANSGNINLTFTIIDN
jgi:hypothetical protein